jgi:hypothetical protein
MDGMSKPQGMIRRGGVFYYRRRVPLDLLTAFQGRKELKESLRTNDLREAKKRRNRAASKFDALFETARATASAPDKQLTPESIRAFVRQYVDEEDQRRAQRFAAIDWSDDPEALREAINETKGLAEFYKHPNDAATVQAVNVAAREAFGDQLAGQAVSTSWEVLRRAVRELERRELARFGDDHRRITFDPLFSAGAVAAASSEGATAISIQELVDRYLSDYSKTKVSVGDKRRAKVAAALALIARFLGSDTLVSAVTPTRCSEFRDLLAKLPSNLNKHFPDETSLDEIARARESRSLPTMTWDTQDHYVRVLRKLFQFACSSWFIKQNPAVDVVALGERTPSREKRNPFTTEQLVAIFNAPLYRGCLDDRAGYASGSGALRTPSRRLRRVADRLTFIAHERHEWAPAPRQGHPISGGHWMSASPSTTAEERTSRQVGDAPTEELERQSPRSVSPRMFRHLCSPTPKRTSGSRQMSSCGGRCPRSKPT